MIADPVKELLNRCKPCAELNRVKRLHANIPHLFDFLIQELREVQASNWRRASIRSLWEHGRWVLTKRRCKRAGDRFAMSNTAAPYYARMVCILHPEFNGFFAMGKSKADEIFGTMLGPITKRGQLRRLLWADGTAIEQGWRPTLKHEPKPVHRRERVKRIA